MPTPTYTALANVTLAFNTSTVSFANIPNTYRDLIVVVNGQHSANGYLTMRFNSNATASAYTSTAMTGLNSTSPFAQNESADLFYTTYTLTANTDYSFIIQTLDANQTNKHKTLLWRGGFITSVTPAGAGVSATVGRWANTSAVTAINFFGNLKAGSTYALYGVIA